MRSWQVREFALLLVVPAALLFACGGGDGGFSQEEVDELVGAAVSEAVAEAQDDFVSEAEAQAKAEAAAKQAGLLAAVDGCDLNDSPYVTADEAGLVIEGEGEESRGVSITEVLCILNGLEVPESVITRMSNTNSTMGIVEGRWDVYEAEWTYHPDNGLNIYVVASN